MAGGGRRRRGLETYRELLDLGDGGELGSWPGEEPEQETVFRTYRIIIGHHPSLLVTEQFPLALYAGAPLPQPDESAA